MSELAYWFQIPELSHEPFLAINLSNRRKISRKHNNTLFSQNKTGDWDIPNAARNGRIKGGTVMLFYSMKGESTIYTGKVQSETRAGATKNGRPRYRLTVTKAWKRVGSTTVTFSNFLSGFKLSSNPTCVWISGSDYTPQVDTDDQDALMDGDSDSGKVGSNYMAWVAQRVGHDIFAKRVRKVWGNECALTGLHAPRLLQACHLKAWNDANEDEKISPNNGLLLCIHLHALLDSHLLGFDNDGTLMLAKSLEQRIKNLVLSTGETRLRICPSEEQTPFLEYHRGLAEQKGNELVRVTK